MRRYYWVRLYCLLLMIVLFGLAVMGSAGCGMALYKESATQRSIVYGVRSISAATDAVIAGVGKAAAESASFQYDVFLKLSQKEYRAELTEEELEHNFRRGYANRIESMLGTTPQTLSDSLNSMIIEKGIENVSILPNKKLGFVREEDESSNLISLRIADIYLKYTDPIIGERTDSLSLNIKFPQVTFYTGNEFLFDHCMVAGKGIYMTGATSSVIGDIFAGSHEAEECRAAEKGYGEVGTYGGLNFLSTQAGIEASGIVSTGDINMNGSFLIFSSGEKQLECFAQRMNSIEGFTKETLYTIDGEFISTFRMEEEAIRDYHKRVAAIDQALSKVLLVSMYYDSDNDENYDGPYRKLISATDVEIKSDFTGIVVTPCNVIVGNDVNFEGLIVSGDRIYCYGNDNIVANRGILRDIIADEYDNAYLTEVKDYLGGIIQNGIAEPDYYVVPYR